MAYAPLLGTTLNQVQEFFRGKGMLFFTGKEEVQGFVVGDDHRLCRWGRRHPVVAWMGRWFHDRVLSFQKQARSQSRLCERASYTHKTKGNRGWKTLDSCAILCMGESRLPVNVYNASLP